MGTRTRCLSILSMVMINGFACISDPTEVDNQLTDLEISEGWILLFNGKNLDGWVTSAKQPSARDVDRKAHAINPHGCGDYMMIHEKQWADFVLSVDFKLSQPEGRTCNSGVFFRTYPLTPLPGKDVGYNGLEIALDGTDTAGYTDTGAIYDLVRPGRNAMRSVGEWNRLILTCNKNLISVEINGEVVSEMDLEKWKEAGKRPDGSTHKFSEFAYREHPRRGYVGLQDHGSDVWFKNIKLKPLSARK